MLREGRSRETVRPANVLNVAGRLFLTAGLLALSSCTCSRPYARAWIIGPDDEIVKIKRVTPWEHDARKLLQEKRVSFFFQETPLSEALKQLSDDTGLTFVVGDMEGKSADPPVTLRVNKMILRHCLDWIATLVGAKWGIHNRAIHFGSRTKHPFHDGRLRVPMEVWRERAEAAIKAMGSEDKRISFFFQETELSKVMAFISDLIGVDVVPELEDYDPPVTIRVNRMALPNAVDWILTLTQSNSDPSRKVVRHYLLEGIDFPLEDALLKEVTLPVDGSAGFERGEKSLAVTASISAQAQVERLLAELKRASSSPFASRKPKPAADAETPPKPVVLLRVYNVQDLTNCDAEKVLLSEVKRTGGKAWKMSGSILRLNQGLLIVRSGPETHRKIEKLIARRRWPELK
jgi:hypothetical protein